MLIVYSYVYLYRCGEKAKARSEVLVKWHSERIVERFSTRFRLYCYILYDTDMYNIIKYKMLESSPCRFRDSVKLKCRCSYVSSYFYFLSGHICIYTFMFRN